MPNVDLTRGPRELEHCDVWPKEREHLLADGYRYEHITVMMKCQFTLSEALLHFHYPTLYENPMVLFCDTGDHLVVYLAIPIDSDVSAL